MANFCSKCGKELTSGEKHECEVKEGKKEAKISNSSIDIKGGFTDSLNAVKNIFVKPMDTIKEFVADSKFITGIIFIIATALINGLSKVVVLMHSFNKVKSAYYTPPTPKYFDEFFKVFAIDIVRYAALGFLAYLVITIILKGKATWKQTLSAVGLSLIVMIAAIIINTVLTFFEGDLIIYISSYVSTFAGALSTIVFYNGIKEKAEIDTNKLFISIASIYVAAEIVVDIVNKIFK